MFCESCGKTLRSGALFCGKCGIRIPIKCVKCGTVGEEDESFCIKCGRRLPDSPFAAEEDEDAQKLPKAAEVKPAPKPVEPPKPKAVEPPPKPEKQPEPYYEEEEVKGWRLNSGKKLLEFFDAFAVKAGFVLEEEVPIDGTSFMLKAHKSSIIIWDSNQNGIKLEGFYKDGKRVSLWVNIQKGGLNDGRNAASGKDDVVIEQLGSVYTYLKTSNPKLLIAIEKCYDRFCM